MMPFLNKCLEQFVHFSANQPYQVVNSETIRKSIKKINFKNPENFKQAYKQIYTQSKKCYIVTFCYGNEHSITEEYRRFKDFLLEYEFGMKLVELYYRYSSEIVPRWENNRWIKLLSEVLIKPVLLVFSKTLLRFII
jgi:cobalamin biosynthesis Co2+ chelatase CbiK